MVVKWKSQSGDQVLLSRKHWISREMNRFEPDHPIEHLDGKLLIAMPSMGDPRFEKSVVFMCSHSEDGAMGLIVNKPAHDLKFEELTQQLGLDIPTRASVADVHFGGPVEYGRGFVLHSRDYAAEEGTLDINEDFAMTATLEVIEDIANGAGPANSLLTLGYAGWGPGQLENEIRTNGWLICDALPSLVFGEGHGVKWTNAMRSIGIDPRLLSGIGGSA
jgi:putative transcriptional regulator